MNTENNDNQKIKIISAIIALILGLILAIGYPTGGVKANKIVHHRSIRTTNHFAPTPPKNIINKSVVKKEKPKKKRIIPVPPPANTEESQDEGC